MSSNFSFRDFPSLIGLWDKTTRLFKLVKIKDYYTTKCDRYMAIIPRIAWRNDLQKQFQLKFKVSYNETCVNLFNPGGKYCQRFTTIIMLTSWNPPGGRRWHSLAPPSIHPSVKTSANKNNTKLFKVMISLPIDPQVYKVFSPHVKFNGGQMTPK